MLFRLAESGSDRESNKPACR